MASPSALLKIPDVQQPELLDALHQNSKFFFFFFFKLGGELLSIVVVSVVHQWESVMTIYIYLYPCPFEPPSPSTPIPPLSVITECQAGLPVSRAASHQLLMLRMTVYRCQCYFSICPTFSFASCCPQVRSLRRLLHF